jgi:hypothetical protein
MAAETDTVPREEVEAFKEVLVSRLRLPQSLIEGENPPRRMLKTPKLVLYHSMK